MQSNSPHPNSAGFFSFYTNTPLYIRIFIALVLGVLVGVFLGARAEPFITPARLVLRLLGALAPFLILVAVMRALMTADLGGRTGARLLGLLILNTLVAIGIGLTVANIVAPGRHADLRPGGALSKTEAPAATPAPGTPTAAPSALPPGIADRDPVKDLLENVPKSLLGPLADDGKVIGVIFIAVAFGLALRPMRARKIENFVDLLDITMEAIIRVLGWIIEVVPLAVFGVVASIVGTKGFGPFKALGWFILAVILALLLQAIYYMIRVRTTSWVRPGHLLKNTRDAMTMAFSTASSTITMPLTYKSLRERVGLREESSSMGALVGSNFNNDGTALYEAMAALFVAQMLAQNLTIEQQILVVLMSVVASVGAAGIPEAGLVTMVMVFNAVGLPPEYIAVLLPVDWFLDRCRTVINMMGDMSVACVLDGKTPETSAIESS